MRLGIAVVALWSFLGLGPVAGQEGPTPLPQERMVGRWVNADKNTSGIKRLTVARKGDTWSVEAWGAAGVGGTQEIPWGQTGLALLGKSVASKKMPYGFATWNPGFAVIHLALHIEKNELVVEEFTIFQDGSRRSNYRAMERFKKQ